MTARLDATAVASAASGMRLVGARVREQRRRLRMSQQDFADAVRDAGHQLGEPNRCSKRLVQKWERGQHGSLQPNYQRALEWVTRLPFETLCAPVVAADSTVAARRLGTALYGLGEVRRQLDQLTTYIDPLSPPDEKRVIYRAWHPEPCLIGARLSAVRAQRGWSQADLAEAVRGAAWELGETSMCTRRLVQKWEREEHTRLRPTSQRALAHAVGLPYEALCEPILEPGFADVARELSRLSAALESRCVELLGLLDYLGRALAGSAIPSSTEPEVRAWGEYVPRTAVRDVPGTAVGMVADRADACAHGRHVRRTSGAGDGSD